MGSLKDERKTLTYVREIKKKSEEIAFKALGDILAAQGGSVTEIPPELVRIVNKYVGEYQELYNILEHWAEAQDAERCRDISAHQMMVGMIQKQRDEIESLKRILMNNHEVLMHRLDVIDDHISEKKKKE